MVNGYQVRNVELKGTAATVGASATNQAASVKFNITACGAQESLLLDIAFSANSGTVTAKFQDSSDGGTTWNDKKTATLSGATGTATIRFLAEDSADWTHLPLRNVGRVVVTTAAASGTTIDAIRLLQPE